MARKAMETLKAEAIAAFPDNFTGEISPSDLRGRVIDFMDTLTPGYCVTQMSQQVFSLGQTPVDLTNWLTPIILTPEFSFNPSTGVVTCNEDCIVQFQLQMEVQVSSSRIVTIASDFSGASSPGTYKTRQEGEGGSDPMIMPLSGLFDAVVGDTLKFTVVLDSGSNVSTDIEGLMIIRIGPLINAP